MATVADSVLIFKQDMAERFPEMEVEEIQELKENAEKKSTKTKGRQAL